MHKRDKKKNKIPNTKFIQDAKIYKVELFQGL